MRLVSFVLVGYASGASVEIASDGSVIALAQNQCGLPVSGTCAGNWETCFAFESLYCPDWVSVATSGDCVIANANQICCDEIPKPCRSLWKEDESYFCSNSDWCIRPSCRQEHYYLSTLYSERWAGSGNNFGECFFSTADAPQCGDNDGDFGTATVGLHLVVRENSLLERAERAGDTSEPLDTTVTEKDSGTQYEVADVADVDVFALSQLNKTAAIRKHHLASLIAADSATTPKTPVERCQIISARLQVCSLASDWALDDGQLCEHCLEMGADKPNCPGGNADYVDKFPGLDFFEKSYCKCCCLDELVDECPSWVGTTLGGGYCSSEVHVGACFDPNNDTHMAQCLTEAAFNGYRCDATRPAKAWCDFNVKQTVAAVSSCPDGVGVGACSPVAHVGACFDPSSHDNPNRNVQCLDSSSFDGYVCPPNYPMKARCPFQ